ncbi:hypothetical protein VPHF86_0044 [Vibrio phage F86]
MSRPLFLFPVIAAVLFGAIIFIVYQDEQASREAPFDSTKTEVIHPRSNFQIDKMCLDGVLYWDGYRVLTPVIDAETLTFTRCEAE